MAGERWGEGKLMLYNQSFLIEIPGFVPKSQTVTVVVITVINSSELAE